MRDSLLLATLSCALATACGDAGGGEDEAAASTGTPASSDGSTGGSSTAVVDGSGSSETAGPVCVDEQPAIVTDIDETLTISDEEFLMQVTDGTYDPVGRESGAELMSDYAALGYRIMYLTARSETLTMGGTGESARDATERWLLEHDYPVDPATTLVVLAPNLVLGESARAYKAESLMMQQAAGWRFDYAYGNATSDIDAYADAGIPTDVTFIIGEEAGTGGTVAVPGEAWTDHRAAQIPTVPAVCEAA